MRAREYQLLEKCVEDGVAYGFHRAHKYTDNPDEESVKQQIINAVMLEISEWFQFEERGNEAEDLWQRGDDDRCGDG